MRERPILFSAPMVRAILEGRKTQTRRVITPQPEFANTETWQIVPLASMSSTDQQRISTQMASKCKYGTTGDRLWVRETFCIESNFNIDSDYQPPFHDGRPINRVENAEYGDYWQQCHYRATDPTPELVVDGRDDPGVKWRPSIFMPRWASRITLEITDVRVQRVQDISENDATAEGADCEFRTVVMALDNTPDYHIPLSYRGGFANLWCSINEKRGYGWASNPWVWAITFKVVQA